MGQVPQLFYGCAMDVVGEIRSVLGAAGDPARAAQQQAYMKSALPFRGIGSADLKALLRPVLGSWSPSTRAEWEGAVRRLWDEVTWREEWYAALALVRHRRARPWLTPEALPLLAHLVTTGAWWDVVDEVAAHPLGQVLAAYPDEVTPVIRDWAMAEDPWLRRSAVLCQLNRRSGTDVELLRFAIEANLADTSFWLRKAIGWALRQHARTDPDLVRGLVEEWGDRLSGLSRREALKHLS